MNRVIAVSLLAASALMTLPACTVVRDQQPVGSYIDDATLTTRVKAKFAEDKTVSALAIKVETFKSVVQLSGVAKSGAEKAQAEKLAREVSGVTGVRNDIIVSP
jgi:hyperosmotically inducible periplasmic protein